jgi:predicted neutral ceramidase superfamily lipid hydrolase
MNSFFTTLNRRNVVLYAFGWICLAGTIICAGLTVVTTTQVLGINAFVKPAKFFVSATIFVWTMGWLMGYLRQQRSVRIYSWAITLILAFELTVVVV